MESWLLAATLQQLQPSFFEELVNCLLNCRYAFVYLTFRLLTRHLAYMFYWSQQLVLSSVHQCKCTALEGI